MRAHRNRDRSKARSRFIFWLGVVVAICAASLVAPFFLPHDPLQANLLAVNQPPSAQYLLGTDSVGRCIACRIAAGAHTTIFSSLIIVGLCFLIGTLVGAVSGYIGGYFDAIVMRVVDVFMAFPSLVFSIAIAGLLGVGLQNAIIALTVVGWTKFARLSRSQVLAMRERTFVLAGTIGGLSSFRVAVEHVLPNVLRPLIVAACLDMGNTMLGLAGLSYLGLGAAPPAPEWGSMLDQGANMFQLAPWAVFAPGCAILIVVMALNMFGDCANELLDPRDSERIGDRRRKKLPLFKAFDSNADDASSDGAGIATRLSQNSASSIQR